MSRKIAFLFPGQGAQYVGMGKELYEKYEIVKETYAEAQKAVGFDVSKMSFESEEINQTQYTQPTMVTLEVAIMRLLESKQIKADMTAGLSLGEYASLVCSGALDFSTAVSLVAKRGKFMQDCIPAGEWGMAAILGLEDKVVEDICKQINGFVRCANYNCPGQLVIAGEKSAIEEACKRLTEAGAKRAMPLNTKAPFHTEKLLEAKENLAKELQKIEFHPFKIPLVKNIDALPYKTSDDMVHFLSHHIVSPVRFKESIEYMISQGVDTFLELGPGKTLSGFVKRISKEVNVYHIENEETLAEAIKF